jgi:hypothetical protein
VKNLLPHILKEQKNNSGSKFFTFHFSLFPFFITFAPVKLKYKQNYGRLPGG